MEALDDQQFRADLAAPGQGDLAPHLMQQRMQLLVLLADGQEFIQELLPQVERPD